ncbi:hypothetical protein HOA92_01610 [archaeon]|jgi:hypothetical protein|nr:hypothetical protein [archaeon]MBT6761709.1 hypothetical protein [archaeon]
MIPDSNINQTQLLALQELERARFLLKRTYPMLQEQKLFLEIIRLLANFYQLMEKFCFLLLQHQKIIPKEKQNEVTIQKNIIDNDEKLSKILGETFDLTILINQKSQLQELLNAKKTGPADFRRKKDYIICENNYKVRVISESSATKFLSIAENFGQILTKKFI